MPPVLPSGGDNLEVAAVFSDPFLKHPFFFLLGACAEGGEIRGGLEMPWV